MNSDVLSSCKLCPRQCGVDRFRTVGFCGCTDEPLVASVCVHKGEEPVISGSSGICNVFFAHCNLRCVFCQNYQISRNTELANGWMDSYDQIVEQIVKILDTGISTLGFVSPTHQVYQMVQIIGLLNQRGYKPVVVYNSNGYDDVETLKQLENIVDIYLPDFKYSDNNLAISCSSAPNYFYYASMAIREMYRQKGASLITNSNELAEWGLIIRHMVIPGCTDDSIKLLRYIADEISPKIHISLMSQYYPPQGLDLKSNLSRELYADEYEKVMAIFNELELRGWMQELNSSANYRPDFNKITPFK